VERNDAVLDDDDDVDREYLEEEGTTGIMAKVEEDVAVVVVVVVTQAEAMEERGVKPWAAVAKRQRVMHSRQTRR
jgi:predicted transposase YdaD